jgi:hypothetical protein
MKDEPGHADSMLSENMAARIEIQELADPDRQKDITDAVETIMEVNDSKCRRVRGFARLSTSYGPAKHIDLAMFLAYRGLTQESEHPASQPVRRQ